MIININQTITNLLGANRQVISSRTSEAYLLTPESGKCIKNIKTGKIYINTFSIGSKKNISDYVDWPLN